MDVSDWDDHNYEHDLSDKMEMLEADLESLIGVVRDEHMRSHDEASMRFCGPVCKAAWALGEGR